MQARKIVLEPGKDTDPHEHTAAIFLRCDDPDEGPPSLAKDVSKVTVDGVPISGITTIKPDSGYIDANISTDNRLNGEDGLHLEVETDEYREYRNHSIKRIIGALRGAV